MVVEDFFSKQTPESATKSRIVKKYFKAWANVMLGNMKKWHDQRKFDKITFIDLFSGPGYYSDGTPSTPIMILQEAVLDTRLCAVFETVFNDADRKSSEALMNAINSLDGIDKLKYKPIVLSSPVDERFAETLDRANLDPTLLFLDPWGYKGISLHLVESVIKDWGCDCILFFNYNRINMALSNNLFKPHMQDLFGIERAGQLFMELPSLSPQVRNQKIIDAIQQELKKHGGTFSQAFCFKNAEGKRPSHYLIFVTKNIKGQEIMKGVMAKESAYIEYGVPAFEYSPDCSVQQGLLDFSRPSTTLREDLLETFVGRTIYVEDIIREHSHDKPYISKNYKDVLKKLEKEGLIVTDPPAIRPDGTKGRPFGTLADSVKVTFPRKEKP